MVPNQVRANITHFTSAYSDGEIGECEIGHIHQFYLVTSFYDETSVSIVQQDGTSYELVLLTFGTYTQKTADYTNHLADGTHIVSNKPINVISGNLCGYNNLTGVPSGKGKYTSSVPDVQSLGQEDIVPNITGNPSALATLGYAVHVIATEDNTIVASDGDVFLLDQGETALFEYPFMKRSTQRHTLEVD